MSNELICSALGVSPDYWPPDHYALLGLRAGDVEPEVVEERVLARMERLRKYQLAHPEAVTDAMNRLAQALVCLSDPVAKRAYDAALRPKAITSSFQEIYGEPEPGPYELAPPEPTTLPALSSVPRASRSWTGEPRTRRPGHTNADARRELYRRLGAARRLLATWRELRDCLAHPRTKLGPADAIEFVGALMDVRDRSVGFDSFGLPGQPGSVVLGLARQSLPLSEFRHLSAGQRVELASDWLAGDAKLSSMYDDLLREVRRGRRWVPRPFRHFLRAVATDALDLTLLVLGLAALGLAIWRTRY
jgi:hypothetical protein